VAFPLPQGAGNALKNLNLAGNPWRLPPLGGEDVKSVITRIHRYSTCFLRLRCNKVFEVLFSFLFFKNAIAFFVFEQVDVFRVRVNLGFYVFSLSFLFLAEVFSWQANLLIRRELNVILTSLDLSSVELEELPLHICICRNLKDLKFARNEVKGKSRQLVHFKTRVVEIRDSKFWYI